MILIPNLACVISHPVRYFSEKSLVLLSKFKIARGNHVKTSRVVIKKSRFTLIGEDNLVQLNNELVHNTTIFVRGLGNQLIIDEKARITNSNIIIKANHSLVHIGQGTQLGGTVIVCCGNHSHIQIGKNCSISENVDIWNSDTHDIISEGTVINPPRSIDIGDHVWIGKGAAVLKGVHIGDSAIIGMHSLVTKDLRPNTINVGNPIREIKENVTWKL